MCASMMWMCARQCRVWALLLIAAEKFSAVGFFPPVRENAREPAQKRKKLERTHAQHN